MKIDIGLINGLVFGIAHTDALFIEYEDDDEMEVAQGVVLMLGVFQIVFYW
jgi:hypothetical protein